MSAVPPEPRASATPTDQSGDRTDGKAPPGPASTDFGPNEWLVDELYQRYLDDPGSVDKAWWSFFADYRPIRGLNGTGPMPVLAEPPAPARPAATSQAAAPPAPVPAVTPQTAPAAPAPPA